MKLFWLIIVFKIKHLLADFPLQTSYMLGKFKPGWDFVLPLAAHSAVHAVFTLAIFLACGRKDLAWLSLVDFIIHFCVDRIKASPALLGRWKPTDKYFWWALGGNQYIHHFTDSLLALAIVLF